MIRILILANGTNLTVGSNHLRRAQVVNGQTVFAIQAAEATTQRIAADTRVRHHARSRDEAQRQRRLVEVREERAATGECALRFGVNADVGEL